MYSFLSLTHTHSVSLFLSPFIRLLFSSSIRTVVIAMAIRHILLLVDVYFVYRINFQIKLTRKKNQTYAIHSFILAMFERAACLHIYWKFCIQFVFLSMGFAARLRDV